MICLMFQKEPSAVGWRVDFREPEWKRGDQPGCYCRDTGREGGWVQVTEQRWQDGRVLDRS